jgi:hypothetical protein
MSLGAEDLEAIRRIIKEELDTSVVIGVIIHGLKWNGHKESHALVCWNARRQRFSPPPERLRQVKAINHSFLAIPPSQIGSPNWTLVNDKEIRMLGVTYYRD